MPTAPAPVGHRHSRAVPAARAIVAGCCGHRRRRPGTHAGARGPATARTQGDAPEYRRRKCADHGACCPRHQPHQAVDELGDYPVIGVLALGRLPTAVGPVEAERRNRACHPRRRSYRLPLCRLRTAFNRDSPDGRLPRATAASFRLIWASLGRTSPPGLPSIVPRDAHAGSVVSAVAADRSGAGSRRTASSARRPRRAGRRGSARGASANTTPTGPGQASGWPQDRQALPAWIGARGWAGSSEGAAASGRRRLLDPPRGRSATRISAATGAPKREFSTDTPIRGRDGRDSRDKNFPAFSKLPRPTRPVPTALDTCARTGAHPAPQRPRGGQAAAPRHRHTLARVTGHRRHPPTEAKRRLQFLRCPGPHLAGPDQDGEKPCKERCGRKWL